MTNRTERAAIIAWLQERADWYHEKAQNPMRRDDGEATRLSELMAEHASVCAMCCLTLSYLVERGDHLKGPTGD